MVGTGFTHRKVSLGRRALPINFGNRFFQEVVGDALIAMTFDVLEPSWIDILTADSFLVGLSRYILNFLKNLKTTGKERKSQHVPISEDRGTVNVISGQERQRCLIMQNQKMLWHYKYMSLESRGSFIRIVSLIPEFQGKNHTYWQMICLVFSGQKCRNTITLESCPTTRIYMSCFSRIFFLHNQTYVKSQSSFG